MPDHCMQCGLTEATAKLQFHQRFARCRPLPGAQHLQHGRRDTLPCRDQGPHLSAARDAACRSAHTRPWPRPRPGAARPRSCRAPHARRRPAPRGPPARRPPPPPAAPGCRVMSFSFLLESWLHYQPKNNPDLDSTIWVATATRGQHPHPPTPAGPADASDIRSDKNSRSCARHRRKQLALHALDFTGQSTVSASAQLHALPRLCNRDRTAARTFSAAACAALWSASHSRNSAAAFACTAVTAACASSPVTGFAEPSLTSPPPGGASPPACASLARNPDPASPLVRCAAPSADAPSALAARPGVWSGSVRLGARGGGGGIRPAWPLAPAGAGSGLRGHTIIQQLFCAQQNPTR